MLAKAVFSRRLLIRQLDEKNDEDCKHNTGSGGEDHGTKVCHAAPLCISARGLSTAIEHSATVPSFFAVTKARQRFGHAVTEIETILMGNESNMGSLQVRGGVPAKCQPAVLHLVRVLHLNLELTALHLLLLQQPSVYKFGILRSELFHEPNENELDPEHNKHRPGRFKKKLARLSDYNREHDCPMANRQDDGTKHLTAEEYCHFRLMQPISMVLPFVRTGASMRLVNPSWRPAELRNTPALLTNPCLLQVNASDPPADPENPDQAAVLRDRPSGGAVRDADVLCVRRDRLADIHPGGRGLGFGDAGDDHHFLSTSHTN